MEVSNIASKENDLFINEKIRAREVMVIGPNGEQLGIKPINDAITLASYAGFDLVLINPKATPPVCKIMDYNKFKYENKKKNKDNMKKQRETNLELKEYRLSVTIDVHDFDTKVRNAKRYLEKGHKVKTSVRFKGREMAHPELGREVLIRFAKELSDVSEIDQQPILDGRIISLILMPKK
ncbi:MAG: translation initiation factor IF-3 [Bacilli bacterium]|nr:translation initiation factor IF-3 [Bacilli bacterium]MDD4282279.1 translation initiation factor IF-3 [Bacilli bacterium]MDD4718425.1 translation initiation factor IF-3 [Bacilli bacterium]